MGRAEDLFKKVIDEGEAVVDQFIQDRKSEELFLDFKCSADNGSGRKLHDKDRENLSKAISGFGNSEGGVIIWGVECSEDYDYADVAKAKRPIQNVKRFVSWLEGAVSGCTVPPHTGVQNKHITTGNSDEGFVATYIPKSVHAPHQVVGRNQYYIRAGSSFFPAPHAVLAGLFGRRPEPNVFHTFLIAPARIENGKMRVELGFLIRNQGPGIAQDLFMNAFVFTSPTDELMFHPSDSQNWIGHFSFGRQISMISKPELRLPPEAQFQIFTMHLWLFLPIKDGLDIECLCGCSGAPSLKFMIKNDKNSIEKAFGELMVKFRETSTFSEKDGYEAARAILNLKDDL